MLFAAANYSFNKHISIFYGLCDHNGLSANEV